MSKELLSKDAYQTVPLPDGTCIQGLFPTVDWYRSFSRHLQIQDKTILDLGSCQFSYGIQALRDGAQSVLGIEKSDQRVDQSLRIISLWGFQDRASVSKMEIQDFRPGSFDITVCSMVLHWLPNPEYLLRTFWDSAKEALVVIWRYPQDFEEPGWHPSLDEMKAALGQEPMIFEMLSSTKAQNIALGIWTKSSDQSLSK